MSKLQYTVHAGNGPPILLVHGLLSSPAQWLLNIGELSQVATPVTVSLYGHADSPSPLDAPSYAPENYILQFEAIREELRVDKWFVCGYSFGASLTMRYALDFSSKVIGHIFTNSMSGFSDIGDKETDPKTIVKKYDDGGLEAVERIPVHPKHAKRIPAEVAQALSIDSKRMNAAGIGRSLAYSMPRSSSAGRIGENTRPTLLVHGAKEKRFLDIRNHLATNMPHLEVVDLQAGHAVNMEQAEAFNDAVVKFVTKQSVS